MYVTLNKLNFKMLINTDMVAYAEPHKDNPNKSVIHYTNGLFVVVNHPIDELERILKK